MFDQIVLVTVATIKQVSLHKMGLKIIRKVYIQAAKITTI